MKGRRKGHLAKLLGTLAIAGPAAAVAATDGEALVERFVTGIDTLESRFEQSLIDADGEVVEVTGGTLYIDRPGRFRWAYSEPYEQLLVADGLNMWSYDVDLAQVTVKPQAEALANTPALLLGGSTEALAQFEYAGSVERGGTTWVSLEPVDTSSGFLKVELGFTGGELDRMIFHDHLEQTTVVTLYDTRRNEPLADTLFRFEPPADADLIGLPAVADVALP